MTVTATGGGDHSSTAGVEERPTTAASTAQRRAPELDTPASPSSSEEHSPRHKKRSPSDSNGDEEGGEVDTTHCGDNGDHDGSEKNNETDTFSTHHIQELDSIWHYLLDRSGPTTTFRANCTDPTASLQNAVKETITVLRNAYDDSMEPARQAIIQLQGSQARVQTLEQALAGKDREIDRLRQAEIKAQKSISNLIKGVEPSNEASRDNAQAKLIEAKLRGEIIHLTTVRDEYVAELQQSERRIQLVQSDLQSSKQKLTKVQQTKMQLERDYRASQALVAALQGSVSTDVDYYKRKNNELQTHLQGMSSVLTEKNREIAELRKDRDRHLSQNRLAALKAATIGYVDADTTSSDVGKVGKKKRHSY